MTRTVATYPDRAAYKADPRHGTVRPMEQSFINGRLRVTWVTGSDDPDNNRPPNKQLTQQDFIKELAKNYQIDLI